MSRDLLWGSLSLTLELQAFLNTFKCFLGYFDKSHLVYRAKMIKPRFYVESQIWKKDQIYLVSGTTIPHYIVPSLKKQLFFYKNPVLDLFCRVG